MLGIKILISSPKENIVIQDAIQAKQFFFWSSVNLSHILCSSSKEINTLLHCFHLLFSFNQMRHFLCNLLQRRGQFLISQVEDRGREGSGSSRSLTKSAKAGLEAKSP